MRPLEFFGIEGEGAFTQTDRAITQGLTLYEQSLCADCKTPAFESFNPEMDGWYEVDDSAVCYACAAREHYGKLVEKSGQHPEPGMKIQIVNTREN